MHKPNPKSYACSQAFRTPLLPTIVDGELRWVHCYKAVPVDGGHTFEVTHYESWLNPDTGLWKTTTNDPEQLPFAVVVKKFSELQNASESCMTFDKNWRTALDLGTDQQTVAPTFAPLAKWSLMVDILAKQRLAVNKSGKLIELGEDGMPTTPSSIDDYDLLSAQTIQQQKENILPASQLSIVSVNLFGPNITGRVGDWLYRANTADAAALSQIAEIDERHHLAFSSDLENQKGFLGIQLIEQKSFFWQKSRPCPAAVFIFKNERGFDYYKNISEEGLNRSLSYYQSLKQNEKANNFNCNGKTVLHQIYAHMAFKKLNEKNGKAVAVITDSEPAPAFLPAPTRPTATTPIPPGMKNGMGGSYA